MPATLVQNIAVSQDSADVGVLESAGANFVFPAQPVAHGMLENASFAAGSQSAGASSLTFPPPDFHGVSGAQLGAVAGDMAMGLTLVGMFTGAIGRMWRFAWNLPKSNAA